MDCLTDLCVELHKKTLIFREKVIIIILLFPNYLLDNKQKLVYLVQCARISEVAENLSF